MEIDALVDIFSYTILCVKISVIFLKKNKNQMFYLPNGQDWLNDLLTIF